MSLISDAAKGQLTGQHIKTFFVAREITKWWNARRADKHTIALLGGWYWENGQDEAGPFRTQSAALRDAYYRKVMQQKVPLMSMQEVADARAALARPKPRSKKGKHHDLVR